MILYISTAILLIGVINATDRSTQPPASICSGRPAGYFVRDVRNCSGWFRCDGDGNSRWGVCTEERLFSEPRQVCTRSVEDCFRCPASIRFVQLEVVDSCDHFIRCIDGAAQQLQCAAGLHFDPQHGGCQPTDRVQCGMSSDVQCPPIDDPESRVWWRDEQHCEQYAVCINGTAVHRSCGIGLAFNLQTLQCDWPQNTDCQGGVVQPPQPPSGGFSCAAQEPLPLPIYPHPTDCRLYYICADMVAHPRECPPDTLFDTEQQICELPERAVCGPGARRPEMGEKDKQAL